MNTEEYYKSRGIEECEELKKCPFCGNQPVLINRGDRDGYDVRCRGHCKGRMDDCGSREMAIESWNKRNE